MADGGVDSEVGAPSYYFWPFPPENCMKLKKIGPGASLAFHRLDQPRLSKTITGSYYLIKHFPYLHKMLEYMIDLLLSNSFHFQKIQKAQGY